MNRTLISSVAITALVTVAGTLALAQQSHDKAPANQPAGMPEMKLPAGWTPEDMQACMMAGMPGKMHEHLAKFAGTWTGRSTMWMAPNTDPMPTTETTAVISMVMDGRYSKLDLTGEIPGMGPMMGLGYTGFDNVSQKFVGTWLDNHSSGIMNGVGELTKDGKVMNWSYTFNCPITKKSATMRQVETYKSDNEMTLEMFCPDPKTGKEYKCMHIEMTRKQ